MLIHKRMLLKAGLAAMTAGLSGFLTAGSAAHLEFQNGTEDKIIIQVDRSDLYSPIGHLFGIKSYMPFGWRPPFSYSAGYFEPGLADGNALFKGDLVIFSYNFWEPLDQGDLARSIRFTVSDPAYKLRKRFVYTAHRSYSPETRTFDYRGKIRELDASGKPMKDPLPERTREYAAVPDPWPGLPGANLRVLFPGFGARQESAVESKAPVAAAAEPAGTSSRVSLSATPAASAKPGAAGGNSTRADFSRSQGGRFRILASEPSDLGYILKNLSIARADGQPVKWAPSSGKHPIEFELDASQGCTFSFALEHLPASIDEVAAVVDFVRLDRHGAEGTRYTYEAGRQLDPATGRFRYRGEIKEAGPARVESKRS